MAKNLPVIILLALTFAACRKSEIRENIAKVSDKISTSQVNIASVSGPTTAKAGQEVTFHLSWPGAADKAMFSTFKTDTLGNQLNIKLFVNKVQCPACSTEDTPASATFRFTPRESGTYYLSFNGIDSTHTITDTLTVQ